ncbi:TPA: hypothetical protein ACSP8J_002618, partial [Aeromonas veronii]
ELNEVKPNVYRATYLKIITVRPNPCLPRSGWRNHARLLGFTTLCANLHALKPNVYREIYLQIYFTDQPNPYLSHFG